MQVDLDGHVYHLIGVRHVIAEAVRDALAANGAAARWTDPWDPPGGAPDGLVVSHALDPAATDPEQPVLSRASQMAMRMAERGRGRVVHLLTALGLVPVRRHPEFSVAQARIVASIRTLAMTCGPSVLVNGVAAGCVVDDAGGLAAGDAAMLGHVPAGEPGMARDVVHAALFLCDPSNSYTTGQVMAVDGGWAAGYARNF